MKIEIKNNTGQHHLKLSDIPDKLFITDEVWVSTSYGQVKVGIVNGAVYRVEGEELVKILNAPVGVMGCHQ